MAEPRIPDDGSIDDRDDIGGRGGGRPDGNGSADSSRRQGSAGPDSRNTDPIGFDSDDPYADNSAKSSYAALEVNLLGAPVRTYRVLMIQENLSLEHLHMLICLAFGWTGEQFHRFQKGCVYYDDLALANLYDYDFPRGETHLLAHESTILQLLPAPGSSARYFYDFESWPFEVFKIGSVSEDSYPFLQCPVCIDGRGANPPETIGGIDGYEFFLEIAKDPSAPEYPGLMDIAGVAPGETFEPERFSIEKTNESLALSIIETNEPNVIPSDPQELRSGYKALLAKLIALQSQMVVDQITREAVNALLGIEIGDDKLESGARGEAADSRDIDNPFLELSQFLDDQAAFNESRLQLFSRNLADMGLSQSTVKRHVDNAYMYVNLFLLYGRGKPVAARNGCAYVSEFFEDYLPTRYPDASKTWTTGFITSIRRFYRFMLDLGNVKREEYSLLEKIVSERKEKWLSKFD